ncbi:VOC family protein [Streptomyces sp. UH6]|uniref:VOC family protein n=1 Tax=Streptomyces sp. UH6 TaxID=2748379 RepID=UPI0015D4CFAA|nr:VOC family protein [Streptomyces sp. UH6]NYV75286.1 VOC family protein [Streptomyces sp. UH6]
MQVNMVGTAYAAKDPARAAAWFAEHFGLRVNIDLGWYVNTQHPDHPKFSLDFVQRDHESWPEAMRGREVVGALVAFLVEDVDAEFARLSGAGAEIVLDLVSEPWGQRRFQVAGPDGLLIEVLQAVAPDPEWLAANGLG